MFLKRLEISGFKSFANKTTLDFSVADENQKKVITAIVGPNGSGKSNIADAIRWAMGEHSMKSLRGKKSEDIIFAGSGKKARLGSAQVTLFFDNRGKKIPLDFEEITLTRKIFRSGENEYLINKATVRLQDIIDLLAKAGIGKEGYAVINQGMSDAILDAAPAERRLALEDAAGVKQYQIKKERSLKKLETTRENLKNVASLIQELEPHLRMLKRQSDRAQKGEQLSQNLKEKQERLFSFLWYSFQSEKENFSREKNDLGIKTMNLQREADKISDQLNREARINQEQAGPRKGEQKKEELEKEINQKEKELLVTEARIEIEKEKEAQRRVSRIIPVDLKYVRERLEKIKTQQEELILRLEKVQKLEDLEALKTLAKDLRQKISELYVQSERGEVEIRNEEAALAAATADKVKADLLAHKADLESKISHLNALREEAKKEIEAEIKREREARQHFFELERSLYSKQDELNKLKDQFNESKIKLARVEVREEDLRAEIQEELRVEPKGLKPVEGTVEREVLEKEIGRLKFQLEQVGGIDPLVRKEYEETKERFEFLTQESQDLEKAIHSLREVIREMETKINQVFAQAFEEINKEFTKYFRIIFGGGNAHLSKIKISSSARAKKSVTEEEGEVDDLSEEEAPEQNYQEEIGVEIFACPPGKRISHLSMLSGGERSLTALALLFAIIAYNPPPFSVLDEVEAALDEANSRRFGRILSELAENTQFVLITHNRETMRQADLLYGVTMGEEGISKLLSVRLDQIGQGGKILKAATG